MNSDKPSARKFAPKPQKRRVTRSAAALKTEQVDDEDSHARQRLLQRFNDYRQRHQPKVETSPQVTFTNESKPVTTTRTTDGPQVGVHEESSKLELMQLDDNLGQSSKSMFTDGTSDAYRDGSTDDEIEDYIEPWDYNTYYPISLPWRRPFSGDPEILDEIEFGEAAGNAEYDETTINAASELGLSNPDENGKDQRLLFFQFPRSLPAMKRVASVKGKEKEDSFPASNQKGSVAFSSDAPSVSAGTSQRTCTLDDLPAGQIGKLLVYKSGAVKLKLGETLYTVSPGIECSFAQDVAVVDKEKKVFCELGGLDGRAVVTPDIDYLLNSVVDLS